jgi:hypothetical protein
MSREHHQGCIPSRIMSPWLSSSFGNSMTARAYNAMPRFAVAIIAHLFLFAWFNQMGLHLGREREAWRFFRVAAVSSVALVCAVSVMARGEPQEKVAGFALCLLPVYCLFLVLIDYAVVFW